MKILVLLMDNSIGRCLERHEFIELKYALSWAGALRRRHSDNPSMEVILDDPYQRPEAEYAEAEAWAS